MAHPIKRALRANPELCIFRGARGGERESPRLRDRPGNGDGPGCYGEGAGAQLFTQFFSIVSAAVEQAVWLVREEIRRTDE